MTRQRTTWNKPGHKSSRAAATSRTADPYSMNQEHPQPSPVEYENGDPDSWAETPTDNQLIYDGYDGESESRNEVGFPEFKPETWKHKDSDQWKGPGKYDNAKVSSAMRKASACERVARSLLRTNDEELITAQASAFMGMPDQVLVATLKRLEKSSPNALPKKARYQRAMACCKFAADFLGEGATQDGVEKVGAALMAVDDMALKNLLKTAATVRAALEEADDEPDETTSSVKPTAGGDEEEPEVDTSAAKPGFEEASGLDTSGLDTSGLDTSCMTQDDMSQLDSMIQQETGMPAPAPTGGLTDLFEAPAAAPAMAPAGPPMMASTDPEITFGGETDDLDLPPARQAAAQGTPDELDRLFDDHPEVQAQREITAAQQEQAAREGGYAPVSDVRTASSGARRLGNVQGSRAPSADQNLENLWERP